MIGEDSFSVLLNISSNELSFLSFSSLRDLLLLEVISPILTWFLLGLDSVNYYGLDPVSSLFIEGSSEDLTWKEEICEI